MPHGCRTASGVRAQAAGAQGGADRRARVHTHPGPQAWRNLSPWPARQEIRSRGLCGQHRSTVVVSAFSPGKPFSWGPTETDKGSWPLEAGPGPFGDVRVLLELGCHAHRHPREGSGDSVFIEPYWLHGQQFQTAVVSSHQGSLQSGAPGARGRRGRIPREPGLPKRPVALSLGGKASSLGTGKHGQRAACFPVTEQTRVPRSGGGHSYSRETCRCRTNAPGAHSIKACQIESVLGQNRPVSLLPGGDHR